MQRQQFIIISAVIVLTAGLVYIGNQLGGNWARQWRWWQLMPNTISVMGEGKSQIAPDSMRIYFSVSELADTTQEAQTLTNTKTNQLKIILQTYEIPESDVKTESISINEEYDWTEGGRNLLGYRATQSLTITIQDPEFARVGSEIIDEVAQIGGVKVNNTSFVLKDKNTAMAEAREEAFQDAKTKAEQLANAGNLRLRKALSISDMSVDYWQYYPMARAEIAMGSDSVLWMWGWANLNPGEMEVNVQIQVVFETR